MIDRLMHLLTGGGPTLTGYVQWTPYISPTTNQRGKENGKMKNQKKGRREKKIRDKEEQKMKQEHKTRFVQTRKERAV